MDLPSIGCLKTRGQRCVEGVTERRNEVPACGTSEAEGMVAPVPGMRPYFERTLARETVNGHIRVSLWSDHRFFVHPWRNT